MIHRMPSYQFKHTLRKQSSPSVNFPELTPASRDVIRTLYIYRVI